MNKGIWSVQNTIRLYKFHKRKLDHHYIHFRQLILKKVEKAQVTDFWLLYSKINNKKWRFNEEKLPP